MLEVERSEAVQVAFPEVSPTLEDKLSLCRPKVQGKFLFVGDEKLWIRGVTYGTFRPVRILYRRAGSLMRHNATGCG
jgi:hypothetical protein